MGTLSCVGLCHENLPSGMLDLDVQDMWTTAAKPQPLTHSQPICRQSDKKKMQLSAVSSSHERLRTQSGGQGCSHSDDGDQRRPSLLVCRPTVCTFHHCLRMGTSAPGNTLLCPCAMAAASCDSRASSCAGLNLGLFARAPGARVCCR